MQTMTLTEDKIATMQGALELARDKYRGNAIGLREMPGHARLAEQFERQAEDCSTMLCALESLGDLDALNEVCPGWREGASGIVTNPRADGGIIDSEIVSGEWFIIFNDGRESLSGFETRSDAVDAFVRGAATEQLPPEAEAGY